MSQHVTSCIFDVYSLLIDSYDTSAVSNFDASSESEGLPLLIFHLLDLPSGKSSGLKTLWWAGSTSKPKAAWPSWKISPSILLVERSWQLTKQKSGQPKVPRPYVQQLRCHCRRPCGVQAAGLQGKKHKRPREDMSLEPGLGPENSQTFLKMGSIPYYYELTQNKDVWGLSKNPVTFW